MSIRPEPAPFLQGVIFALFATLIRPQRLHVSAVGPNSSDAFEDVNTAGLLRWAAVRGLAIPPEAVAVGREARRWICARGTPARPPGVRRRPGPGPEPAPGAPGARSPPCPRPGAGARTAPWSGPAARPS